MYGSQQRQTGGRRTKQTSFWTGPDGKRTEEFGGGGIPCLASQPLRRGGVAVEAVSTEIVYSLFFFFSLPGHQVVAKLINPLLAL